MSRSPGRPWSVLNVVGPLASYLSNKIALSQFLIFLQCVLAPSCYYLKKVLRNYFCYLDNISYFLSEIFNLGMFAQFTLGSLTSQAHKVLSVTASRNPLGNCQPSEEHFQASNIFRTKTTKPHQQAERWGEFIKCICTLERRKTVRLGTFYLSFLWCSSNCVMGRRPRDQSQKPPKELTSLVRLKG